MTLLVDITEAWGLGIDEGRLESYYIASLRSEGIDTSSGVNFNNARVMSRLNSLEAYREQNQPPKGFFPTIAYEIAYRLAAPREDTLHH